MQTMEQVLKWNKLRLPLIPDKTPHESLEHYSLHYPELATATVGERTVIEDKNVVEYEVQETLGTKG